MSKILTERDVFLCIERELGGKITSAQRQGGLDAGGRSGWFIEFCKDGKTVPYYQGCLVPSETSVVAAR